jgi:predicted ribosome quality control (RQC) complex YloA/Tae2 family protein
MHYDALTAGAVADEWRHLLVGGRIDKIFQPDVWSLALLVRSHNQNWQVFQCFNPRFARAHLVRDRKLGSGFDAPTPFVMLLRKHLESARIVAVHQPPLERILHLETAHGAEPPRTLVIELLGRQSNAVLLDEAGVILGALRHVTADMSRTRVILPHLPYSPPAPAAGMATSGGARLDPRSAEPAAIAAALGTAAAVSVAERLPRVLAISPTAAAEAVFRAAGEAGAADVEPAALADALHELFAPLADGAPWSPSAARRGAQQVAFAPYRLRSLDSTATVTDVESISLAIERFFAPRESADRLAGLRGRLQGLVKPVAERAERRLGAIEQQVAQAEAQLSLRAQGELLLTYQPAIARDQQEVILDDFSGGAPQHIPVNPALTAVQNAQVIFKRYARAKRTIEALGPQRAELAVELAFARQVLTDVALCETPAEFVRLETELRGEGFFADRERAAGGRTSGKKAPRKGERGPAAAAATPTSLQLDGFEVLYGKTSQLNDALTFRLAGRKDLWLHAKGVPGSHVVIRAGGRPVPDDVLLEAAGIAAYLSASRGETKAAVDYTTVSNVRRQPGGKPGLVYYVSERTVQVAPLAPEAAAKEAVHAPAR